MPPFPAAPAERLSLALDPVLDLRAAALLKDTLQQGLDCGNPLTIDAGAVTRMSTACVQVLSAFVLAAQKAGRPLSLKNSSTAFDVAFNDLGLAGVLNGIETQALA